MEINRHVYQKSRGGKTYIPMDGASRIIVKTSPRLAKILGYKCAQNGFEEVKKDLEVSHELCYHTSYIQNVIERLSEICEDKAEKWTYEIPLEIVKETKSVSVSRDGAMVGMREGGYRETMGGVLSLCDKSGKSIYAIYVACSPQYGKSDFNLEMDKEINILKTKIRDVKYIGLADGAKDNWQYLAAKTDIQILDYYHATEYLYDFADAYFKEQNEKIKWCEKAKNLLLKQDNFVLEILSEMQLFIEKMPPGTAREIGRKSIVYFSNNKEKMNYFNYLKNGYAIGSGVMEAACKTLIKQRCSRSGMRWSCRGLDKIFAIRQLVLTGNRWNLFWDKIDRYGF